MSKTAQAAAPWCRPSFRHDGTIAPTVNEEPIRLFLIDDHPTVVWGLERLIESEAPRMVVVGKAHAASTAVPLLEEARADVILLDLDLGQEDGVAAIPQLRAVSGAKVLVLTGVRDAIAHESAIRAGALGVVGKETSRAELLQAIERVHRGELAVDRRMTERLLATMSGGAVQPKRSIELERVAALTARERDIVLSLMDRPQSPLKTVATSLGISERTLRNHLSSIYEKLGVSGRLDLYVFSREHMREARE